MPELKDQPVRFKIYSYVFFGFYAIVVWTLVIYAHRMTTLGSLFLGGAILILPVMYAGALTQYRKIRELEAKGDANPDLLLAAYKSVIMAVANPMYTAFFISSAIHWTFYHHAITL